MLAGVIIYLLEIFDDIFLVRNSHFVVKIPNVFLSWHQHIDSIYGTQGGLHFAILQSDAEKR